MNDIERLNPEIKIVEIGKINLRKIKIYPLSFKDQSELSDLLAKAFQVAIGQKEQSDVAFISTVINLLKENILTIFNYITDKEELEKDILSELTNNQLTEIAQIIYDVNYMELKKKVGILLGEIFKIAPLNQEKLSQQSSEDTLNTDSNISLESPIEKAE